MVSEAGLYEPASTVERVPLRTETTLADRLGAGVQYAALTLGLAALAFGLLRGRRPLRRSSR